ncbi:MAG: GNAT family N-acetyltransferase, partial [Proteobacteria bacterium]
MAALPLIEETSGGSAGTIMPNLAGFARTAAELAQIELFAASRPERRLAVYPASAGFELVDELDFLSARAVEPNVFFNPRFLTPAMPRLEDRDVRLAVIRDGDEYRSRLRLLAPFTVEKPAAPVGVPIIRIWSHPFGPLGAP